MVVQSAEPLSRISRRSFEHFVKLKAAPAMERLDARRALTECHAYHSGGTFCDRIETSAPTLHLRQCRNQRLPVGLHSLGFPRRKRGAWSG